MTINRKFFFDQVRGSLFNGKLSQSQADGMTVILDDWEKSFWEKDDRWLSYALCTTFHETNATMQPVREAYWLSEAWRKKNLRYYPYYGRGDVQLTWLENYERATKEIRAQCPEIVADFEAVHGEFDLVKFPDQALEPVIAVVVMFLGMEQGWFAKGETFAKYFNEKTEDPKGARRVINGRDKDVLIASYYPKFYAAISYTN